MAEKYDVILEGGQSNAEGNGFGPVSHEYVPTSEILYLTAERTVSVGKDALQVDYADKPFEIKIAEEPIIKGNKRGALALSFAEEYVKNGLLKKGRKLLIVRAAVGGTGFLNGHWGLQDKLYLKMLEMVDYALSLDSENKIVAFLWHQGENDAVSGNTPENYHKQLSDMLKEVRKRYGNVPFIAGDFVHEWKGKNIQMCKPIVEMIKRVVNENDNAAFVETEDLPSNNQKINNGDDLHYCRESLHILGQRYFSAFAKISETM